MARWVPDDYPFHWDGRERTVELFDADNQLVALERIEAIREAIERSAGGPVVVLFRRSKTEASRSV
jgi:hypothetical protein